MHLSRPYLSLLIHNVLSVKTGVEQVQHPARKFSTADVFASRARVVLGNNLIQSPLGKRRRSMQMVSDRAVQGVLGGVLSPPAMPPLGPTLPPAIPPATYMPKFVAATLATTAAAWHLVAASRRSGSMPSFHAWQAVFFAGGAASAAVGATLEAAFADLEHGAAWDTMLFGVEVAALGAWVSGVILLGAGTRFHRALTRRGAISGLVYLLIAVVVTFVACDDAHRFDVAFELATPGGIVLLAGALTFGFRVPAQRLACGLVCLGIIVTGFGYMLDAAWLASACAPSTSESCPLPKGMTADSVYHTSLAISYLLIWLGGVRCSAAATVLRKVCWALMRVMRPSSGTFTAVARAHPSAQLLADHANSESVWIVCCIAANAPTRHAYGQRWDGMCGRGAASGCRRARRARALPRLHRGADGGAPAYP